MKKVVIVTDGARLRAFRFSDRLQGKVLSFRCAEIRSADPAGAEEEPPDAGHSEIAGLVSEIIAKETPFFWILAAPRALLNPLLLQLDQDARERLTRTVACDLIGASLAEIALRFPPTHCQQVSSARSAPKPRRRPTTSGVEY